MSEWAYAFIIFHFIILFRSAIRLIASEAACFEQIVSRPHSVGKPTLMRGMVLWLPTVQGWIHSNAMIKYYYTVYVLKYIL